MQSTARLSASLEHGPLRMRNRKQSRLSPLASRPERKCIKQIKAECNAVQSGANKKKRKGKRRTRTWDIWYGDMICDIGRDRGSSGQHVARRWTKNE